MPFFKVGKELKERVDAGRTTAPRAGAKRAPVTTETEAAAPETTNVTTSGPVAADSDADATNSAGERPRDRLTPSKQRRRSGRAAASWPVTV